MTNIIDGNIIANNILKEINNDLSKINIKPVLGIIIIGDNKASLLYIKKKQQACNSVGILTNLNILPYTCEENTIINLIENLNTDNSINGIIVQLPLPKHLDEEKILDTIS